MDNTLSTTHATLSNSKGLNRSCEACRARKIRCYSLAPASRSCARCTQRGLDCVFLPPSNRTRRRVDARIKNLEENIESLMSTANGTPTGDTPSSCSSLVTPRSTSSTADACCTRSRDSNIQNDVIDSGLLTLSEAIELYNFFRRELVHHYPVALLSTDAEEMRQASPTLFLSAIAAAAGSSGPDIAPILNTELEESHARRVMVDGERSLTLAQALLISAVWHYPPKKFDSLKFGRYANMAAGILIDLDLLQEVDQQLSGNGESLDIGDGSQQLAEKCRTLVACFLLSSGIALSFRSPSVMSFTPVIGKCITYLKHSPQAATQDRRLALRAELQRRAELVSSTKTANNPAFPTTLECDFRLSDTVAGLTSWMSTLDQQEMNKSMIIDYYYILMNAHEQILHSDHRANGFKPPYILSCGLYQLQTSQSPNDKSLLALQDSLCAAQLLLETFLSMPVDDMRTVPVIVYTRMFYAVVTYAKLHLSAQSSHSHFCGLLNMQSCSFELYIQRLITALQAARGTENFRVPKIFLGMLEKISAWCMEKLQLQLENLYLETNDEEWEPMRYTEDASIVTDILSTTTSIPVAPLKNNPWAIDFDTVLSFADI